VAIQTKSINYARDDVFIISVNKSTDSIEECEAKVYINPINILAYYGLVSALYSKLHSYITYSDDVDKELKNIRSELYSRSLISEMTHDNMTNINKIKFMKLFDRTVKVYRHITSDLPKTSIFPLITTSTERKINADLLRGSE